LWTAKSAMALDSSVARRRKRTAQRGGKERERGVDCPRRRAPRNDEDFHASRFLPRHDNKVGGASCSPVEWKGRQDAAPTFGSIRNDAHRNAPSLQPFVIARAEGPRQSICVYLCDVLPVRAAACLSLPRLAGGGCPGRAGEGVHLPARSAAYVSLGDRATGRLEKMSVAALRRERLPLPALRATLSRQAGEGKEMGAFAPNRGCVDCRVATRLAMTKV
jgi:hypothetical protein